MNHADKFQKETSHARPRLFTYSVWNLFEKHAQKIEIANSILGKSVYSQLMSKYHALILTS